MAKKITIEGTLNTLSDAWGGIGDGSSVHGTIVPAGTEWGMNRGEVERFIKAQLGRSVGYLYRDTETNILYAFNNETDYLTWLDNPSEGEGLVLISVQLPSISNEDSYSASVVLEAVPEDTQPNKSVSIRVKGSFQVMHPNGTSEELSERLKVIAEVSATGASNTWRSIELGEIMSNLSTFTEFSLESILSVGMNYIRVRVRCDDATSAARAFTINVVDMYLVSNNNFSQAATESLLLSYYIGGNISKNIQFVFGTGHGSGFIAAHNTPYEIALGTETNPVGSTPRSFSINDNSALFGFPLDAGKHTLRARLYHNERIKTDWVESEYLVADSSNHVIVNNISQDLTNWTDAVFFDWSGYSPSGELSVVFRLTDQYDRNTYGVWPFSVRNGEQNTLRTQLAIADDTTGTLITFMHIEDSEGNQIETPIQFNIYNDVEYAPTIGADFIMQPANRNNNEANRGYIKNEATGSLIAANFNNFGWINDGWVGVKKDLDASESSVISALHIAAGSSVEFSYNPFADFTWSGANGSNEGSSATFEIDFRVSNVLNYETPVLQIGDRVDGSIWGLELLPTKGYLLTENKRDIQNQDVDWAEGVRTHLAVNIVESNTILYVRIFINGVINREFIYGTNDRFTKPDAVMIRMGNATCDLDVFGIRSYRTSLNTAAVLKDYKASMSTSQEKDDFAAKNDILRNGKINWQAAIAAGYNVIGHTGELPKYGKDPINPRDNPTYTGVTLQIHIEGDEEHSGILTDLEAKGQGTTAMTYNDWNQSYKITDNTKHYDENGVEREGKVGMGYAIAQYEAAAKKLVGKINFASSMQSHKLGLTYIYSDIYRQLVSDGRISQPSQMANESVITRLSVYEKPFLFFHRQTANDEWTFKYLMTFGAGKGDKPTFGFDKKKTPHMLMVEGADNEPALCNFMMPWTDDVTYNPDKEAWYVGETKHINFGFGTTEEINGKEYPNDTDALESLRNFWNFVFEHSMNISYYTGSLTQLNNGDSYAEGVNPPNTNMLYWLTSNNLLYRYVNDGGLTKEWVPALWFRDNAWTQINVLTQYQSIKNTGFGNISNKDKNDAIISARLEDFKSNASNYFHVDDALYHSCFVKLFAATDNRAKNTYYYTDPVTLKVRWMQDDLDTTLKTNNLGQNRKPYYVEEHDTNDSGSYYWAGESNSFYNLLEAAFGDDSTLSMQNMMRYILGAMSAMGGSVIQYIYNSMVFVQDYFPATAYNQQAELVYENAQTAKGNGLYSNSVDPITQSCGNQRWSEYQWLVDRIMYISSWCKYGEFAAGGLNWRSAAGVTGEDHTDIIELTVGKWMYPRMTKGGSIFNPSRKNNVLINSEARCQPNDKVTFVLSTNTDIDCAILGYNYLLGMGDLNIYTYADQGFTFMGKMLQRVDVNPSGTDVNHLGANSLADNAEFITEMVVRGVNKVSGGFDISKSIRLQSLDLRGTPFTSVKFPQTERLASVYLPATITRLEVDGQPQLASVNFEESTNNNANVSVGRYTKLETIIVRGNILLSQDQNGVEAKILTLLKNCVAVQNVEVDNIDWGSCSSETLLWLAGLNSVLKGRITVGGGLTFAAKLALLNRFGNIDDEDNDLYVIYTKTYLTGFSIACDKYIGEAGQYQVDLIPSNVLANNITSIEWGISNEDYATIDASGMLDVSSIGEAPADDNDTNAPQATITCTIKTLEGSTAKTIVRTKTVYFYEREAHIGDYVFHDGTYSNEDDARKQVIGICFYNEDGVRLLATLTDVQAPYRMWGLQSNKINGISVSNGSYDAYDVFLLPNIDGSFTINSDFSNYYTDNDGYLQKDQNTLQGRIGTIELDESDKINIGDGVYGVLPIGKVDTLRVIKHRDNVLNNADGDDLTYQNENGETLRFAPPIKSESQTEWQNLTTLIEKIINVLGNSAYQMYYFPFASYAYAYEPTIRSGLVLADKFKANNWWAPSTGEILRLFYHQIAGHFTGRILYTDMENSSDYNNRYGAVIDSKYYAGNCTCSLNQQSRNIQATWGAGWYKSNVFRLRAICEF